MKRTALQKKVARDLVATLKTEVQKGGGKSSGRHKWEFTINGKRVILELDYDSPPLVSYGTHPNEVKFTLFGFRERRQLRRLAGAIHERETDARHNRMSGMIVNDLIAPKQDVPDPLFPPQDEPIDKTAIKKAKKDLQKWVDN